jgi:hypothetical protein
MVEHCPGVLAEAIRQLLVGQRVVKREPQNAQAQRVRKCAHLGRSRVAELVSRSDGRFSIGGLFSTA